MLRSVGQRRVTGEGVDPRVDGLRTAVSRLRRELAALRTDFTDRGIAEDELAALDAMAAGGAPEVRRLRRSLLLVAGSVGSVSALAESLVALRLAVDLFGPPPEERPAVWGEGPAVWGEGPAASGEGPAVWGEGPAASGEGPAAPGAGPAAPDEGPSA